MGTAFHQASPLWAQLAAPDARQVAAALSNLLSGYTPTTVQQASTLVGLLSRHGENDAIAAPALILLARWARQGPALYGGAPSPGDDSVALLQQAVQLALRVISAVGVQGAAGPAAARFLGSAAEGCPASQRWEITEAMGSALLACATSASELPARDLIAGLADLLPALMDAPAAACWILAALLSACQVNPEVVAAASAPGALVDALAPLYPMMRTAATAAMRKAPPEHAVTQLLQPLAAVLGSAVSEAVAAAARLHNWAAAAAQGAGGVAAAALPHKQRLNRQLLAPAAAGVMALGGLLEGLLRNAPGFEGVQSLAGEAEGLLRRASEAAAAWVLNGEGDGPTSVHIDSPASSAGNMPQPHLLPGSAAAAAAAGGPSSSGGSGGVAGSCGGQEGPNWGLTAAGVKLLRDSCSLATVQAFQGCRRPAPNAAIVACQTATLLHSALSLEPLFALAASGAPPAAANALLAQQAAAAPCQLAAELAGNVAHHAGMAALQELRWLAWQFERAAGRAFRGYRRYSTRTPGSWLGAVNSEALKSILDKLFMSSTVVLTSVWTAKAQRAAALPPQLQQQPGALPPAVPPASAERAERAARMLGVFGDLQFCRIPLPMLPGFLKEAAAAMGSSVAAVRLLVDCFPPYAELYSECAERGGAPTWLVDTVAASKVQFLMTMLLPFGHMLAQATMMDLLAPLCFLYQLHPHQPTSTVAHQLFAAMLPPLPPSSREQLGPFYIDHALHGYPGATLLDPLQQGVASLLRALPSGSAVSLYCVDALLRKCGQLAASGGRDTEQARLFGVAVGLLLAIEHGLFRAALDLVRTHFDAAPRHLGPALLTAAFSAISHTDDALRKPLLMDWYQHAAASVAGAAGRAAQGPVPSGSAAAPLSMPMPAQLVQAPADGMAWQAQLQQQRLVAGGAAGQHQQQPVAALRR